MPVGWPARPADHTNASALALLLVLGPGCGLSRLSLPVVPPLLKAPGAAVLWHEPFEQLDADRWRAVEVEGQTDYLVVDLEGRRCLMANSRGGASILLAGFRFDPQMYRWLSWEWRVDQLVEAEALQEKRGSDAAARVYVYFDSKGLPWQRHNIDYVWSATLPVGTILNSAFSSASKIIVAESGTHHLGQWRTVTRHLERDYELCFGKEPPDVLAIGVMTDTDNTGGSALAYFDELHISRTAPRGRPGSAGED